MGPSTQLDPIGLAGGLNAYGFADGDPINYSDPYGTLAIPAVCLVPPVSFACAHLLRLVARAVVASAIAVTGALVLEFASNTRQNKQYRDAIRQAERRMSCRLNDTGRDELYKRVDELDTRAGADGAVSFNDIVEEATELCRQRKYTDREHE